AGAGGGMAAGYIEAGAGGPRGKVTSEYIAHERARLRPRPGSHTRHLFPVRPEHPRRRAARQPAQDGELAAMVDVVKQDRRPQEVADRPLVAAEILERAVQVRRSEPSHPPDRPA